MSIDESIDTKIKALRAHVSQMKDWDPEPRIKEWASSRAKRVEATYAETFRVITLVKDEDWEKTRGEVMAKKT
jgi:LmbE family N-acetylglucosaminyl deacetylase